MSTIAATQIKPLADRVLVRPIEQEERTKAGIVLPDTAKEKPQMGKVLAVGTGRLLENGERQPLDVKEGDRILFSKYSGTEIKVDDEKLLLISERDILAIVEG
ncbi:MAG TPA: co-chaperone GroES [Symbiobacteriaceae bacterium]|nr:co-chaperone GroES [Symbiobacteriaceae bacterium]